MNEEIKNASVTLSDEERQYLVDISRSAFGTTVPTAILMKCIRSMVIPLT